MRLLVLFTVLLISCTATQPRTLEEILDEAGQALVAEVTIDAQQKGVNIATWEEIKAGQTLTREFIFCMSHVARNELAKTLTEEQTEEQAFEVINNLWLTACSDFTSEEYQTGIFIWQYARLVDLASQKGIQLPSWVELTKEKVIMRGQISCLSGSIASEIEKTLNGEITEEELYQNLDALFQQCMGIQYLLPGQNA